jgi:hypothetical protein
MQNLKLECVRNDQPQYTVAFPKERQVTRHASLLRYPSRSKDTLFLLSAAQSIANLFDLEDCPGDLIWPSFGNGTVSVPPNPF